MKKTIWILASAILGLISCGSGGGSTHKDTTTGNSDAITRTDTTKNADTMSRKSTESQAQAQPLQEDSKKFVKEAAGGGMMEVELGKMAQVNGQSQRVKDFGAMMVNDHTRINNELKTLANGRSLAVDDSLPSKMKKEMDDLHKKRGADFDKAYMKMMVDDHEKDIKAFEKAGKNLRDADVKDFASRNLPTLQAHLDSAKVVRKSL
ncbi:MAG: DUF4142 domain-containing protein [Bacteroidetes bacterium]|nr:MAG: DUF4142 domain-containing protein [Bacteroidota bacterium]